MTDARETWRSVVGYEGLYEVSDLGRVRSLDRVVDRPKTAGGPQRLRGRILRTTQRADGRLYVTLSKGGKVRPSRVSVLVLTAFVGPRPMDLVGCHNDGNPANNSLSNLRWDTQSENMRDKGRHGTDPKRNRTHCPRGHQLVAPNLVESRARQGQRVCLACARARAARQQAAIGGRPFDLTADADLRYALIMT